MVFFDSLKKKKEKQMNSEVYAVFCDGFRQSEFMNLQDATNVLGHYMKYTQTYQYECAIYMKDENGSLTRYRQS